MSNRIYLDLSDAKKRNHKKLAILIDPDKNKIKSLPRIVQLAVQHNVDYFLIGGSLILDDSMEEVLAYIQKNCDIACILFPGNSYQLSPNADGILFLSLISGRNPELLIGKHVLAAPFLKNTSLEIIPTGYMLIDGGVQTSVSYISNSMPIPANKNDIASSTALAGQLLGLKTIYMDAGSGAKNPISVSMIKAVRETIDLPLIIGGGIKTSEKIKENLNAGADMIVIGNAIEQNPDLLGKFAEVIKDFNCK
jgi:putative glycerol-1-phosphate prenyltransferase